MLRPSGPPSPLLRPVASGPPTRCSGSPPRRWSPPPLRKPAAGPGWCCRRRRSRWPMGCGSRPPSSRCLLSFALANSRVRLRVPGAVVGALSIQVLLRQHPFAFHGAPTLIGAAAVLPVLVSAHARCRSRVRRRTIRIIGAVGAACIVATVAFGVAATLARHDLERGASQARAALSAAREWRCQARRETAGGGRRAAPARCRAHWLLVGGAGPRRSVGGASGERHLARHRRGPGRGAHRTRHRSNRRLPAAQVPQRAIRRRPAAPVAGDPSPSRPPCSIALVERWRRWTEIG